MKLPLLTGGQFLQELPVRIAYSIKGLDGVSRQLRRAWQDSGASDYPSPRQVETPARGIGPPSGTIRCALLKRIEFDLVMPAQSVAALEIELSHS